MKKKQTFIKLFIVMLTIFSMPASLWAQSIFGGGSGTETDPYIISSIEHFDQFASNVNSGNNYTKVYFRLDSDLDYSGRTYTPVGGYAGNATSTGYYYFEGTFDGNGHKIKNVVINTPTNNFVGLFGTISSYTCIKNLTLGEGSIIKGNKFVGGIAGFGFGYYAYNDRGIRNCVVEEGVSISANSDVGGIIGITEGYMTGCLSLADISATTDEYVGGIVGDLATNLQPDNCYYVSNIITAGIGGATAAEAGDTDGARRAYALCEMGDGLTIDDGNVICYNNIMYGPHGGMISLKINGLAIEFDAPDTLTPFNATSNPVWTGTGVETDPYTVKNTSGLNLLSVMVNKGFTYENKYFLQTADIDYYNGLTWISFEPIGNDNAFKGTYDGGSYRIKNINYFNSGRNNVGLFGHTDCCTIKNVVLMGTRFNGKDNVGSIAGYVEGGNISNCVVANINYNIANVSGDYNVGGIVGKSISRLKATHDFLNPMIEIRSYISDCLFMGEVYNYNNYPYTGSIIGYDTSQKSNNYYTGNSSGVKGIGGYDGNSYDTDGKAMYGYSVRLDGNGTLALAEVQNKKGVEFDGVVYAGANQSVFLDINPQVKYGYETGSITADAGTLAEEGNMWKLAMPESNVVISVSDVYLAFLDESEDENYNTGLLADNLDAGPINVMLKGRTLYRDGHWNTLMLPFSLTTIEDTPLEGAEIRTLTEGSGMYDNGTLTLNFTQPQTNIAAQTAYIVRWNEQGEDIVNPMFTNVTLEDGYNIIHLLDNGIQFFGMEVPYHIEEEDKSILYMGSDDKLYYPNAPMTIKPFRAFFILLDYVAGEPQNDGAMGISNFIINYNDDTLPTGISNTAVGYEANAWYDLSGRRLEGKPSAKGIYINNNRKVTIK